MNTLVAEIRALSHLPRRTKGFRAEYLLAGRLREAMRQSHLSELQRAELAKVPKYDPERERADCLNTLMADIRAVGRMPRMDKRLVAEYALANRLDWARRKSLLSESQLADLAEIKGSEDHKRKDSLVANI